MLDFDIVTAKYYDVVVVTAVMHCDVIGMTTGHVYDVIGHNSYNVITMTNIM